MILLTLVWLLPALLAVRGSGSITTGGGTVTTEYVLRPNETGTLHAWTAHVEAEAANFWKELSRVFLESEGSEPAGFAERFWSSATKGNLGQVNFAGIALAEGEKIISIVGHALANHSGAAKSVKYALNEATGGLIGELSVEPEGKGLGWKVLSWAYTAAALAKYKSGDRFILSATNEKAAEQKLYDVYLIVKTEKPGSEGGVSWLTGLLPRPLRRAR